MLVSRLGPPYPRPMTTPLMTTPLMQSPRKALASSCRVPLQILVESQQKTLPPELRLGLSLTKTLTATEVMSKGVLTIDQGLVSPMQPREEPTTDLPDGLCRARQTNPWNWSCLARN